MYSSQLWQTRLWQTHLSSRIKPGSLLTVMGKSWELERLGASSELKKKGIAMHTVGHDYGTLLT